MNRLWIFGDSYSSSYNTDLANFGLIQNYLEKEKENGISEIRDINYWFAKYLPKNIAVENLAVPGYSNDSILDKFYHNFNLFMPGDFIILQVAPISRFRVTNKNNKLWYEVQPPINKDQVEHIREHTGWDESTINSVGRERTREAYATSFINQINFIKSICNLKKVRIVVTSSDKSLENISSIPDIFHSPNSKTIVDKYPRLRDWHPSFEGWEFIVKEYLDYFGLDD